MPRFFEITGKTCSNSHLIRAHFEERSAEGLMRSVFNDAYAILFSDFLVKGIYGGYSFELPQLIEAIQMYPQHMLFFL